MDHLIPILIGIALVALIVWAFWPRKKGVNDWAVLRNKVNNEGKGSYRGGGSL